MRTKGKRFWVDWLWDAWCVISILGIWPRFIEPRLLSITHLSLPIFELPDELVGLKILQFSDLHWHASFSSSFSRNLIRRINQLKPDLIVFTGDLLCQSKLDDAERLGQVLSSLKALHGCFAILGNHDYEQFVSINDKGDYDIEHPITRSNIGRGFKRLLKPPQISKRVTPEARQVGLHQELMSFFKKTPFRLLHNASQLVSFKQGFINVCGLGEYTLGRLDVEKAFKQYDSRYPGIILVHNPDGISYLRDRPGELILSGHTHGGQVNLPGLWKKLTRLENLDLKRGLKKQFHKWIYINRGVGSVLKFRWFSLPELSLITLQRDLSKS